LDDLTHELTIPENRDLLQRHYNEFFQISQKEEPQYEHERLMLLQRVQQDWVNDNLKERKKDYARFTNDTNLIPIKRQWVNDRLANPPKKTTKIKPPGYESASAAKSPRDEPVGHI